MEPTELTRDLVDDLRTRATAGELPVAYVLRDGRPTWVTVSCEGVIANIQADIVEPDPHRPGRHRVRSNTDDELVDFHVPEEADSDASSE